MRLLIEVEVGQMPKAKIRAYKIVNRISYENKVISATFNNKKYAFTKIKKPRHFLRDDFDKIKAIKENV